MITPTELEKWGLDHKGQDGKPQALPLPENLKAGAESGMLYRFEQQGKAPQGGTRDATPDDLNQINSRYALKPLEAAEIAVFDIWLANDLVDRDGEKFSRPTLGRFMETIPGKSFLIAHRWGPPGEGRIFKATLVEKDGAVWLVASTYMLREGNEQFLKNIDAGIYWATSIGFTWALLVPVDKEGKDLTREQVWENRGLVAYWEFREDPEHGAQSEAMEASLVYLGAQYGAAIGHESKGGRTLSTKQFRRFAFEFQNNKMSGLDPFSYGDDRPSSDQQGDQDQPEPTQTKQPGQQPAETIGGQAMKFCPECGTELNNTGDGKTAVCPKCSKKWSLDGQGKAPEGQAAPQPLPDGQAQPPAGQPKAPAPPLVDQKTLPDGTPLDQVLAASFMGLKVQVDALGQAQSQTAELLSKIAANLDNIPNRKGASGGQTADHQDAPALKAGMIKGQDGRDYMVVPTAGASMRTGWMKHPDEKYDALFSVDPDTGRVTADSIKAFCDLQGIKYVDPTTDMDKPHIKGVLEQQLKQALATAMEWGVLPFPG